MVVLVGIYEASGCCKELQEDENGRKRSYLENKPQINDHARRE
jgi:hypothetical protein